MCVCVGRRNPEQKDFLQRMCIILSYPCTATVVALKFKCHQCEVSLEGARVMLQHIPSGSDWADDDFFEPNIQGLCSTKNS